MTNNFIIIFYLSPRWWFVIVDLLWLSDVLYLLICVSYFWIDLIFINNTMYYYFDFLFLYKSEFSIMKSSFSIISIMSFACYIWIDLIFINNMMHNYNMMLILLFWLFVFNTNQNFNQDCIISIMSKEFHKISNQWINLFIKRSNFYYRIIFHLLKFKSTFKSL